MNDSDDYIYLTISNYHAQLIRDSMGIEKIRELSNNNEAAEMILDDLEEPSLSYELEDKEEKLWITIFKENVTLDVNVDERWFNWARAFEEHDECGEYLQEYRIRLQQPSSLPHEIPWDGMSLHTRGDKLCRPGTDNGDL